MDKAPARIVAFQEAMLQTTEYRTTVHAYASALGGAHALNAHTDPYPVVVLQVNGTKKWQICTPIDRINTSLSSAARARAFAAEHSGGARKLGERIVVDLRLCRQPRTYSIGNANFANTLFQYRPCRVHGIRSSCHCRAGMQGLRP